MADVRCPMCGKPNPADLEECQYCQARLRPIWDTSPSGDQSEEFEDQPTDLPDWLKSLREPTEEESEQPYPEAESRTSLPDWLSDLRKQPAESAEAQPDEISDDSTARAEEGSADWLQDFLSEDNLAEDEAFSRQMNDAITQDDSDWMSRLGSTSIGEEPPLESSEPLAWLAELEQAAPDLSTPGVQDWYSPKDARPPEPVEPLPDWLVNAGADFPEIQGEEAETSAIESDGIPALESEEELAPAEDIPLWLQQAASSVQETAETIGTGEEETTEEWSKLEKPPGAAPESMAEEEVNWLAGGEGELPDWLFTEPSDAEPAEAAAELSEPVGAELPEWLFTESTGAESVEPTEAGELPEPAEAELPEWLFTESTRPEPAEAAVELPEAIEAEPELQLPETSAEQPFAESLPAEPVSEELPDWLVGGEELPDWLTGEEEVPDWLKPSLEADEAEAAAGIAAEELLLEGLFTEEPLSAEAEQELVAEEPEAPEEEEIAPWLAGAGAAAAGLGMELSEEQPEGELGWLSELEATYGSLSPNAPDELTVEEGEGEGLQPATAVPTWLSRVSEDEEQVLEEGAESDAELKPAELPSWLQAMRPVGVTAAAAGLIGEPEPQQVEGAGPLAGLRGALPAEPEVSQVQKPAVYAIKLQVTDSQQLQAELLRGLIDAEGLPATLPGRPVISSQQLVRIIIAVLLIFPVLFVLLTGVPQLRLPASSPDVVAMGRLIDGLSAGAPVLLAVDYQPGFSGEMDAVTLPVVQRLFGRGAYMAVVSTISTGPVQAEHLLAQVGATAGAYQQVLASSINLGYIPGGPTGLLAFAQSPRTVLPTNLRGQRAWDAAALQSVDTLGKFALVVVATENPDVARYWVEQVQPTLGATPMVMVLSAQAEPLVRPYYQASPPQVQGLIGGLSGGAAFLSQNAQTGPATRFWSPYGVGALFAVILMVLAALVNLISTRLARQKENTGGSKQP